jgi:hypothetical protein
MVSLGSLAEVVRLLWGHDGPSRHMGYRDPKIRPG